MFEIPLGYFMSSRDKNFPVGNFCSRVASQIIYIAKKNNRPIYSLDKSTKRFKGKNNGGRVSSEMAGGKQSSESGQMRKDIDST